MSLTITTLNRGEQRFGFYFGGAHRVVLGNLPAMPTNQFCLLGGEILLQISGFLDEESWIRIGNTLRLAFLRDEQTKINLESLLDLPEFLPLTQNENLEVPSEAVSAAIQTVSLPPNIAKELEKGDEKTKKRIIGAIFANLIIKNGWTASLYDHNPFVVESGHVNIDNIYNLSYYNFGSLVSYILAGGTYGWDPDQGMPKSAKDILARLKKIW